MLFGIIVLGFINTLISLGRASDPDDYLEEASQIYSTILHKYNPKVRPPERWPNQVSVTLFGSLWHIREIDLMKQEMQSLVNLQVTWVDKRLAWYPNNVRQIATNVSTVWSPELIYDKSVLPPREMFPSKVTINSEGHISWYRQEAVTTFCLTDPFSRTQTCTLSLKLTSPGNQETFTNQSTFTLAESFVNHMWEVQEAELNFGDTNQTDINFVMKLYKKDKISEAMMEHEGNCTAALNSAPFVHAVRSYLPFLLFICASAEVFIMLSFYS